MVVSSERTGANTALSVQCQNDSQFGLKLSAAGVLGSMGFVRTPQRYRSAFYKAMRDAGMGPYDIHHSCQEMHDIQDLAFTSGVEDPRVGGEAAARGVYPCDRCPVCVRADRATIESTWLRSSWNSRLARVAYACGIPIAALAHHFRKCRFLTGDQINLEVAPRPSPLPKGLSFWDVVAATSAPPPVPQLDTSALFGPKKARVTKTCVAQSDFGCERPEPSNADRVLLVAGLRAVDLQPGEREELEVGVLGAGKTLKPVRGIRPWLVYALRWRAYQQSIPGAKRQLTIEEAMNDALRRLFKEVGLEDAPKEEGTV